MLEVNVPSMRLGQDWVLVVLAVFCNLGYVLILHILGNATCCRLGVLAMGNAVCFLSSMGYRNKRLFLYFGGRQDAANVRTLDDTRNMTPPEDLVRAAILRLLALPIAIAVLAHIFEEYPLTIGRLLVQVSLILAAATLLGGLALFLLAKAADYPKETSKNRH